MKQNIRPSNYDYVLDIVHMKDGFLYTRYKRETE